MGEGLGLVRPLPGLTRVPDDYRTLAEVAREQGDPVHFMAGLLAAGKH